MGYAPFSSARRNGTVPWRTVLPMLALSWFLQSSFAWAKPHPFLLVSPDMYARLQGLATQPGWRELKEQALATARSSSYPATADAYTRSLRGMTPIMDSCALAYILDPANRVFYKNKIRDTLAYWPTLYPDISPSDYDSTAPGGGAFFMSLLALDIVYNDLTPAEQAAAVSQLTPPAGPWPFGWPHGQGSTQVMWYLFTENANGVSFAQRNFRDELFGPAGPVGKGYISTDGVYFGGSLYATGNLGAAGWLNPHMTHIMDVMEFTQTGTWYTEPRMQGFYRWLFTFAYTPFGANTPLGDTFLRTSVGGLSFTRVFSGRRFGEDVAALAAWRSAQHTPVLSQAFLLNYVLMMGPVAPKAPVSTILGDGGAAFWERSPNKKSLMGVLQNMKGSEWHSHKETNSIVLAGFGEFLLVNSGYAQATHPDIVRPHGTYSRHWFSRNARSGNTVLIGGRDHLDQGFMPMFGGGVSEGFAAGALDYASGDSGPALPNGKHQRNFVFVHPAAGTGGYFVLFDEIAATDTSSEASVLLHPNSDSYVVEQPASLYRWTINGALKMDVNQTAYLSVFLATPPNTVEFPWGLFGSPTALVEAPYLEAKYALDSMKRRSMVTVLLPHEMLPRAASFTRLSGTGWTGARIEQGTVSDFAVEISQAAPVQVVAQGTVQGSAALFRTRGPEVEFYFVRKGTLFDDGRTPRKGFSSSAKVSIFLNGTGGKVVSPGADVTFFHQGIVGVSLNGTPAPIVASTPQSQTIHVTSGAFDLQLALASADGGVTPVDGGRWPDAGVFLDAGVSADAGESKGTEQPLPAEGSCGCHFDTGGSGASLLLASLLVVWWRRASAFREGQ